MSIQAKALLSLYSLALVSAISLLVPAHSASKEKPKPAMPRVELVLQGPGTFGAATPFRATIVNRSKVAVTLVPPKRDRYDEFSMIWTVFDSSGKELLHAPKQFAWCDGLAIHLQTLLEPGVFVSAKKRLIQESDLVTLGPGEKLELCELGDPIQFFPITSPGKYKVALVYEFDPSNYALANENAASPKSEALKNAVPLDLLSNSLTVRHERLSQTLTL